MQMLAFLDENNQESPRAPASGTRRIEIGHDLILFRTSGDDPPLQREIPPGSHEVVEIVHRKRIWLKLSGEDFGNAAICWEAIPPVNRPSPAPPNKGFLSKMAIAINSSGVTTGTARCLCCKRPPPPIRTVLKSPTVG
jgi:hypothetical protein